MEIFSHSHFLLDGEHDPHHQHQHRSRRDFNVLNARYGLVASTERNIDWIKFGADNQFPQQLIELAKKSLLHGGIVESKTNMIKGGGPMFEGDDGEKDKAVEFFKSIGLMKLHKELCGDVALFGGSFPQLIYGADSEAKSKLSKVIKPGYDIVRLAKPVKQDDNTKVVETHFYHPTWNRPNRNGDKAPKPIDVWTLEADKGAVSYYIANRSPILKHYAKPDYFTESAINAILLDAEVINFDVSELKNGMNASYIITFFREDYSKTDMEKEERVREQEEALVRESLTGTDNTGRVVIQRAKPSKTEQKAIDIQAIPSVNNADRPALLVPLRCLRVLRVCCFPIPLPTALQSIRDVLWPS